MYVLSPGRFCLGYGLAIVEMKVLLALVARHCSVTCDNNTEWVQAIGKVPKVSWGCCLVRVSSQHLYVAVKT